MAGINSRTYTLPESFNTAITYLEGEAGVKALPYVNNITQNV